MLPLPPVTPEDTHLQQKKIKLKSLNLKSLIKTPKSEHGHPLPLPPRPATYHLQMEIISQNVSAVQTPYFPSLHYSRGPQGGGKFVRNLHNHKKKKTTPQVPGERHPLSLELQMAYKGTELRSSFLCVQTANDIQTLVGKPTPLLCINVPVLNTDEPSKVFA